jgi:hypothetical protein
LISALFIRTDHLQSTRYEAESLLRLRGRPEEHRGLLDQFVASLSLLIIRYFDLCMIAPRLSLTSRWPRCAMVEKRGRNAHPRLMICHASDEEKPESSKEDKDKVLLSSIYKRKPTQLPEQPPQQPSEPVPPPETQLTTELRLLLALLVENGGVTGTAAVAIAILTGVDPFGSFSLNLQDIQMGMLYALPLILLDSIYQLPDYSSPPSEMKTTMRLLLPPKVLQRLQEEQKKLSAKKSDAPDPESMYEPAGGNMRISVEAIAQAPQLSRVDALLRMLKISLDLLQQFYSRNNPAIGSSVISEGLVIILACLADESLYRAVLLTLLSFWIRDRVYEAGLDLDLDPSLDVLSMAQWGALGIGVSAGVVAFTLRALREKTSIERARAQAKLLAEEAKKVRVPRSLPGWEKPMEKEQAAGKKASDDLKLPEDLVIEASSSIADGMAGLSSTVWLFEGFREVLQVGLTGAAFISTGNLASSFVGSVVVQSLFSFYQRRNLDRMLSKRRAQQLELLEIRRRKVAEAAMKNEEEIRKALEESKPQDEDTPS